jgi:hypothetical protein
MIRLAKLVNVTERAELGKIPAGGSLLYPAYKRLN